MGPLTLLFWSSVYVLRLHVLLLETLKVWDYFDDWSTVEVILYDF